MANPRFKAASWWVGGTKMAEFESNEFDLESGDEQQFGDPGALGYSDGAITGSLQVTGVVPVAGLKVDITKSFLNKEDIDIQLTNVLGKTMSTTARITKCSVKSSHRNGTQRGEFTLGFGEPSIQ